MSLQELYSRLAPALGRRLVPRVEPPTAEHEAGFRRAQRLAYECAVTVAARVKPGTTERQAARWLAADLHARGVRAFLHRPFAWFGEHARFSPHEGDHHAYHPSDRALGAGEGFILDVSPIVDGYTGDIGYTVFPRETEEHVAARRLLLLLREEIRALFETPLTLAEIWDTVDRRVRDAGYVNCHALYPLRVLGHRVYHMPPLLARFSLPRLPIRAFGLDWFSPQALGLFTRHGLVGEVLNPETHAAKTGFWAIEPHVGRGAFGAKFEEILAVDAEGRARWIDDDTPHVREARARGWALAA